MASTSSARGVDVQLGDLDWRSLYQALPKHVRQAIAKQSLEEACSYILFWECKMDEKLKWPGCESGDGGIDDLETFLSVRQWCHGLLVDFDMELALQDLTREVEDTARIMGLTPAMFTHVTTLMGKAPELFQPAAALSCLRCDSAAPAKHSDHSVQKDSRTPAIKKLKTDPRQWCQDADSAASADTEWCRDFATNLLQGWPFSSVQAGERMHFGTMVHLLVRTFESILGSTWPTKVIFVDAGHVQRLGLPQLQAQASHLVAAVSTPHHDTCACSLLFRENLITAWYICSTQALSYQCR